MHFVGPVPPREQCDLPGVVYHGAVHDERQVRALLRASDVLVCPSWSEGMPTVIMEAMASGLAVIATDVGAVGRQVDQGNGWLLPGPVPADIRAAMQEAMGLPPRQLAAMKQHSLDKVREQFTWERVIQKKIDLLARFAKEAAGPMS